MHRLFARSRRLVLFAVAVPVGVWLAGCQKPRPPRADPVNPEVARASLKAAMESWKKGEPIAQLKQATPPVIVQDIDWLNGSRLLEYEIDGDGKPADANLLCPVKLTVRDKDGKESKKRVTYFVGTHPHITVFREVMP